MRRDAREVVFKVLFSEMFSDETPELFDELIKEADLKDGEVSFARELLSSVRENKQKIDAIIDELANNYNLSRVYPTDKCALYIGFTELIASEDVPYIVAIDEAVAICKKYSTAESVNFVNGIFAEYVKRNKIT